MMIIYTLFVNCLQKFGVFLRISPFLLLLCKIKKLTHLFCIIRIIGNKKTYIIEAFRPPCRFGYNKTAVFLVLKVKV